MVSIPITRNERAAFASAPSASSAAAGTCPIRSPADQVRATVVLAYVPSRQGWRLEDAADGADGADGIFGSSVYPDDPVSNPAFATERNLDAQYPQERLRAVGSARRRQPASFEVQRPPGAQLSLRESARFRSNAVLSELGMPRGSAAMESRCAFDRHVDAATERLEGRLELIQSRGVVETKQAVN
jgi:hypothetical protein